MAQKHSRRQFIQVGTAAGIVAATRRPAFGQAPTVLTPKTVKPVVIASSNGNRFKNGGPRTAVEEAFQRIVKGDDVLDALIAGVNLNELDPEDSSVGYGGLPNADGVVQLDASCMHGPKRQAGAVAALEGVRTPSLVAKAVLEMTDHHLLVGKGAQEFARNLGFKIEEDLNTERSRKAWLEWKRRTDSEHYLDPAKRNDPVKKQESSRRVLERMAAEGWIDPEHLYGTINCDGINAKGEICGVTTTSGLAWKIAGRAGDSPILGAGLYVDDEVGAAGSTGRGEANLYSLTSFLIVENMRRGMHPKDAGMEAMKRVKANTVEKRLLTADGNPRFSINYYILNKKGEYAGVAMYATTGGRPGRFAVCTENGPQTLTVEGLLGDLGREG
jgi:N4-(beta-N-acetylglucosaminyl)-L-asparaginase